MNMSLKCPRALRPTAAHCVWHSLAYYKLKLNFSNKKKLSRLPYAVGRSGHYSSCNNTICSVRIRVSSPPKVALSHSQSTRSRSEKGPTNVSGASRKLRLNEFPEHPRFASVLLKRHVSSSSSQPQHLPPRPPKPNPSPPPHMIVVIINRGEIGPFVRRQP
jgi:hypothetical protein